MSDKIMRMFEDQRSNPFQFKYDEFVLSDYACTYVVCI